MDLLGPVRRLGGVITRPVPTLTRVLRGEEGDFFEPLLLAVLTVFVAYPLTVGRFLLVAQVSITTALGRLFALNGFVWQRLLNEGAFCLWAAGGFFVVARLARKKVRLVDALNAATYLYVPMALLTLLGALLAHADVRWPILPSHPLDGWWVLEGNRLHIERFVLKLVVEMAWPAMIGLAVAWRLWTERERAEPRTA